jgi:hypothetical protein
VLRADGAAISPRAQCAVRQPTTIFNTSLYFLLLSFLTILIAMKNILISALLLKLSFVVINLLVQSKCESKQIN